jgi:class 3 adenylate cyclase/tetratricopeptide (TPR) repeat protein
MLKVVQDIILIVLFTILTGIVSGQNNGVEAVPDTASFPAVDSLFIKASSLLETGNLSEARDTAERLLRLSKISDNRVGKGNAYYLLGRIQVEEDDLPGALRNYFMAVREYEWIENYIMLQEIYTRMGDIYAEGGIFNKSVEYYLLARRVSEGKLSVINIILDEKLAESYYWLQEYDSSLHLYLGLLPVYQDERPDLALSTLMQISSCLYKLERYADAIPYNQLALSIARTPPYDAEDEVEALNSLGYNYKYINDFKKSAAYFKEAVEIAKANFPEQEIYTVTLVNLAISFQNTGELGKCLEAFGEALQAATDQENQKEESRIAHLMSYVYFLEGDYYNAGIYNAMAINAAKRLNDGVLLQNSYQMASLISTSLYDYEEGMMYYRRYLSLRDSLQTARSLSRQELAQQEYTVERTEKELAQILYERELQNLELKNLRIESEKKQQELELLKKTTELQNATIKNQELEKKRALQELLLAEEKLAAEKKDREIQDLKVQQQLQESELKRRELEQIRQQNEIELLTITKQRNELTIQKQRARNAFLAGIILLAIFIVILLIRWLRFSKRTNRVLSEQRNKIQQQKEAIEDQYDIIKVEQEKSDRLLLNILPEHTANELKEKGRAVPKQYSMVTVLFTDFVGFTKVAERLTPEELILELDHCFMEFDRIIGNHNLEKIKTIGDAYMCAGGIPVANNTNPQDAVEAALEIKAFMDKTREERRKNGSDYWELRIGIHTGEVVAGVVGKKKFAYDIWGDAVNTASRMESSGEAGKVNISGSTYQFIKEDFTCTYRGKVYAKNKGEIDMYFVEPKRGHLF